MTRAAQHSAESLQTLRFGESCGSLTGSAVRPPAEALREALAALETRIGEAQEAVRGAERWEVREVRRKDPRSVFIDDDGSSEVVPGKAQAEEVLKVTVLVGAEEERRHLSLLEQRKNLLRA